MARHAELGKNVGVANRFLEESRNSRNRIERGGVDAIQAANSPEDLNALTQAFATQERNLGKQEKLFASIDPAIMEASTQALQLLRGEDAKALGPIRQQRDQERQNLVNRLREQMGPGAETSTAGIQALNQFDQQTSQVLSGAQQQGLSQMFGIASSGAQNRGSLNQGIGQLANMGQSFANIQQNRTNRITGAHFNAQQGNLQANQQFQGAQSNVLGARSEYAGGSGAQFTQQTLEGQGQMQAFGQLAGIGGTILGGVAGKSGGGKKA
jgi:hypothetical protein